MPGSPDDRPRRGRRNARHPTETDAGRQCAEAGPDSRGFVFAATGPLYTVLARRAARTLRAAMPGAAIDLFTDQEVDDATFDRVHALGDGFFRPKMEAMRRSRFERTVTLDADVLVLVPVPEMFDILDACDVACAPDVFRIRRPDPTRAFTMLNSGVVVHRKSPEIEAFFGAWEAEVRKGARKDQGLFRRLLFTSGLRFLPLGYEYNFMHLNFLYTWAPEMGAPRILHAAHLHRQDPGNPEEPFGLRQVLGAGKARLVEWLLASDWSLGGNPELRCPGVVGIAQRLARRFSGSTRR
jgi:hypothetical protein